MTKPARPRRDFAATARRRWPAAEWVIGDGPYASVAHCGVITVMLFAAKPEAEEAKAFIDHLACGGACTREHEIVDLGR